MRLDRALVLKELAPSRTKAQELIKNACVFLRVGGGQKKLLSKPSLEVSDQELKDLFVEDSDVLKFVSRGGLKLDHALSKTHLNIQGIVALDLGQSTGGFTDCLLQRGAGFVLGIENGKDQIHPSLVDHSRQKTLEKTDARTLSREELLGATGGREPQLVVGDLSFISLDLIIPSILNYLRPGTELLFLVKPQFELSARDLNKNGIVKDESKLQEVRDKVVANFQSMDLNVIDYFESPIEGGDGNKEYFIYAKIEPSS